MKTKSKTCILILTLALAPVLASAQTLLVSYNFDSQNTNDSSGNGNNATLKGTAAIGANGSGVSGQAGDYAINNTATTLTGTGGSIQYATGGILLPATTNLNNLTSFTISLWYNLNDAAVASERLFDDSSFLLAFNNPASNGTTNALTFNNGATAVFNTSNGFATASATGSWIFVALTYNSTLTSNQLSLYVGDGSDFTGATYTTTWTNGGTVGATGNPASIASSGLAFGSNTGGTRAMNGYLDDINVFGSATDGSGALNLSQINALQASAIPEPAACAALASLVTLGFVAVRRRRNSKN